MVLTVVVLPNLDKRGSANTVEKIGDFFLQEGIEAFLPELCDDMRESFRGRIAVIVEMYDRSGSCVVHYPVAH